MVAQHTMSMLSTLPPQRVREQTRGLQPYLALPRLATARPAVDSINDYHFKLPPTYHRPHHPAPETTTTMDTNGATTSNTMLALRSRISSRFKRATPYVVGGTKITLDVLSRSTSLVHAPLVKTVIDSAVRIIAIVEVGFPSILVLPWYGLCAHDHGVGDRA